MKKLITLLILIVCIIGSARWSKHQTPDTQAANTYVVKAETLHQSLFFTGIIEPLNETALTCPIDAVIETMPFNYGQLVEADDIVLTLNSSELEKQYNDALTEYLKAKDNDNMTEARFHGTQELWDAGLISKNNYLSEKSSVNTTHIALMQATQKLTEMMQKTGSNDLKNLSNLDIAKFKQVQQVLTTHHNHIDLKAPATGLLLYPPKTPSDNQNSQVTVGASVKAGQAIALIGNMSGIHVNIDIPETDINKIERGMPAIITGAALGKHRLQGKIISVNTQAIPNNGGKSPSFSATVEVQHLTPEQRAAIKIGMSAAIELHFAEQQQLLIPIKAIQQVKGQRIVTIQKTDGSTESRKVVTGLAKADQVVIEQGVKPGEVIVYATT